MRERSWRAVAQLALAAFVGLTVLTACRVEQKPPPKAPASVPVPAAPAVAAPNTSPQSSAGAAAPAPVPQSAAPAEASKAAPSAPPAAAAAGAIGRIDSLEGSVRVVRSAGDRAGEAGMAIEEGDTVIAGPDAWALLAMSDGASVTLRADSELRFESYRYSADGAPSGNSAILSLSRGALRSISGEIGRTNPASYEVRTPGASIAIKGTDHEPAYYPRPRAGEKTAQTPGTYDKVNSGESVIRSAERTLPVKPGQILYVHDNPKLRPQLLAREPAFYQQHAEADKRAEARRAEFHRTFEQERRKRARVQKQALKQEAPRAEQQMQQKSAARAAVATDKADQKASGKNERKSSVRQSRKAKDEKKGSRKDVPPASAERLRNMQRGDKAATGTRAETPR
jgi:hypothetical protein